MTSSWLSRYSNGPMLMAFPGLGLLLASKLGLGYFIGGAAASVIGLLINDAIGPLVRDAPWYKNWLLQVFAVSLGIGALAWVYPTSIQFLLVTWAIHHFGVFMYYYDRLKSQGEDPQTPGEDPPITRPRG